MPLRAVAAGPVCSRYLTGRALLQLIEFAPVRVALQPFGKGAHVLGHGAVAGGMGAVQQHGRQESHAA
mgnify:CR=1 FL=1